MAPAAGASRAEESTALDWARGDSLRGLLDLPRWLADEDSRIREIYEKELAASGLTCAMPPVTSRSGQ
jgi:hypothetical protein